MLFPLNRIIPSGDRHRHDVHEALFVLRGSYETVYGEGEGHRLSDGEAIWYPAGVVHTPKYPDQNGATEIYCCTWIGPPGSDRPVLVVDRDGALLHYFRQLHLIESITHFRSHAYRAHLLACPEWEFMRLEDGPSATVGIEAVKAHIDKWFMQPLSVANLCTMFGYSRSTLFHDFRAAYNTSPVAYLLSRRADKARLLLTTTDLALAEVARQSGVGGIDQLTRLCKGHYGCSATALRARGRRPAPD